MPGLGPGTAPCASDTVSFSTRCRQRPVRDFAGAKTCVQRDHPSAKPSFSSIGLKRTPAWMTRDISEVLNNLHIAAARWRFSTCCKNLCADIGLARRWRRRLLSCPSSLRNFLCSLSRSCPLVGTLERTQSSTPLVNYSLEFHIKFRVQFGQRLHRDL